MIEGPDKVPRLLEHRLLAAGARLARGAFVSAVGKVAVFAPEPPHVPVPAGLDRVIVAEGEALVAGIFAMRDLVRRAAPVGMALVVFADAGLVQVRLPENDGGMIAVAADEFADVAKRLPDEGVVHLELLPAGNRGLHQQTEFVARVEERRVLRIVAEPDEIKTGVLDAARVASMRVGRNGVAQEGMFLMPVRAHDGELFSVEIKTVRHRKMPHAEARFDEVDFRAIGKKTRHHPMQTRRVGMPQGGRLQFGRRDEMMPLARCDHDRHRFLPMDHLSIRRENLEDRAAFAHRPARFVERVGLQTHPRRGFRRLLAPHKNAATGLATGAKRIADVQIVGDMQESFAIEAAEVGEIEFRQGLAGRAQVRVAIVEPHGHLHVAPGAERFAQVDAEGKITAEMPEPVFAVGPYIGDLHPRAKFEHGPFAAPRAFRPDGLAIPAKPLERELDRCRLDSRRVRKSDRVPLVIGQAGHKTIGNLAAIDAKKSPAPALADL